MRYLVLISACFLSIGCTTYRETNEQRSDRELADHASISEIAADPVFFHNQWVRVVGWLSEHDSGFELKLYQTQPRSNPDSRATDIPRIGIRKSELAAAIRSGYLGKKVFVTGRIDARCPIADAWRDREMKKEPGSIVMLSGYCHYSLLAHLDHAIVELTQ